ncbi:MAG: dihydropyrimidinase [Bdellovibrionales bacterium GWA2_49_15]|nr:MAG: dihydropyrimidinase [Bdellovibrionales bacterium GWA2_49_15]HAZ14470.1 dihydropyrimidinase [Bdellovibrionales bacterium]
MKSLLIKNGEIITSIDRYVADILVQDGVIKAIGKNLEKPSSATEVIDATGLLVLPGAVDGHVHMELPFMGEVSADDFETGTAAGLAGGTTSIIDFVIPSRNQDPMEALTAWKEKAKKSVADYAFHMSLTWYGDKVEKAMHQCVKEEGITSFKTFMAYRGAIGVEDHELISIMNVSKKLGSLITAHCEHGEMVVDLQNRLFGEGKTAPKYHALSRPAPLEGEATGRAIMLARMTQTPLYIVHVTAAQAVDAISEARSRGQAVYGETCPQYLLLDDSVYDKPDFEGAAYVMSPPIRPKGHQDRLWGALKSGIIQTVATDHCPFRQKGQKELGKNDFRKIPNGAAGVQNRLSLLYTYGVLENKIDLHQFVDLNCTRPAKLFGMYPRKGAVAVGSDADLVLWDKNKTGTISAKTHFHKCDRNIFEGFKTQGGPLKVIVNGRVQFDDGNLKVERGAGRYIRRNLGEHL